MSGIELGYRYESPIVAREPGTPPVDGELYAPTTWPGARVPHVWLADGAALQDRIGPGFTLLRLGAHATGGFAQAFAKRGAPFEVLDLAADARARAVLGEGLLLLRPDLHVAWRGAAAPTDAEAQAVTARATGFQAS